jgi:hypothetical protein
MGLCAMERDFALMNLQQSRFWGTNEGFSTLVNSWHRKLTVALWFIRSD